MAVKYTTLEGGSANFKIISSLGVLKGYVEIVQTLTGRDLTITNVHTSKNTIDNRYGKYQTNRERETSTIVIDAASISQVKNKSFVSSGDNRLVSTENVPSTSDKKISNYNHSIEIVSGIDNNILTTFDERTLKNLNNRAIRAKKAINNAWSNTDKLSVEATSTVNRNGSSSLSTFFEFRRPVPGPPEPVLPAWATKYWSGNDLGSGLIDSWLDRVSGLALTAAGGERPTVATDGSGFKHALFNGTSTRMEALLSSPQPNTIVIFASSAAVTSYLCDGGTASGRNALYVNQNAIGGFAGTQQFFNSSVTAKHVFAGVFDNAGQSRLRGTSGVSDVASMGTQPIDTKFVLGDRFESRVYNYHGGPIYAVVLGEGYAATAEELEELVIFLVAEHGAEAV